jgi:hypothetical protein
MAKAKGERAPLIGSAVLRTPDLSSLTVLTNSVTLHCFGTVFAVPGVLNERCQFLVQTTETPDQQCVCCVGVIVAAPY